MKFIETVTLEWKPNNRIEYEQDRLIKNIRLIKPDGTPDSIRIEFSKHTNLNETLYCEDFPVYRYFHDFKKIEQLPFALNKTGICESIDIITNSDSDFAGKLRYDVYDITNEIFQIHDEILISRYEKLNGQAIAFIQKNYKKESKQNQDEIRQENLQLTVKDITHLISYTRLIRKVANLTFFLFEIQDPELYMDLSEFETLPENVFAFAKIKT